MGGHQVQSIVAGVVIFVVALALFEPMAVGSDNLYREFIPRCESSDDTTVRMEYVGTTVGSALVKGDHYSVTKSGTACVVTAAVGTDILASTGYNFETEDGLLVTGTSSATAATAAIPLPTSWQWMTPTATLVRFGAINKLVLSLLPLVIVVGFMGTAFVSLYTNRNAGGSGIANAIKVEITTLVITLIAIFVSPIALDFISSSSTVITEEGLTVTRSFGTIMDLLFGFMPVGIVLGIIAMVGWRGYSAYKGMSGGKAMM